MAIEVVLHGLQAVPSEAPSHPVSYLYFSTIIFIRPTGEENLFIQKILKKNHSFLTAETLLSHAIKKCSLLIFLRKSSFFVHEIDKSFVYNELRPRPGDGSCGRKRRNNAVASVVHFFLNRKDQETSLILSVIPKIR
jgi:hypothetical protein